MSELAGGGVWSRIRSGYSEWILLGFTTLLLASVYFGTNTNLPPIMFLFGIFLLGYLDPRPGKGLSHFWPAAGISGAILLLAFFRSDFVEMVAHGMPIGKAYDTSTRYFQAPMLMWFTTWAMICAAWRLGEDNSRRVITWMGWLVLAVTALQFIDAAGNDGMRNAMNVSWFHGHRPEMVVVDASNLNCLLLMLFWPLAFWFMHRGWMAAVGAMAVTVLWASVTVDTNAHMLVLVLGAVVFFAAKYWPIAWTRRGILPERVAAALALFWVVIFPPVMIVLMRTGMAAVLHAKLPPSWSARIDIWSYSIERCLDKPWWGWGYESARRFAPAIPLHTHNLSLQAWLELGIPGLLLLGAFWFSVFWFIAPKGSSGFVRQEASGLVEIGAEPVVADMPVATVEQSARPYMLAAVTGYFLLNAISYGMWRDWLYCLGALMAMTGAMAIKAVKSDMKLRIKL